MSNSLGAVLHALQRQQSVSLIWTQNMTGDGAWAKFWSSGLNARVAQLEERETFNLDYWLELSQGRGFEPRRGLIILLLFGQKLPGP